MLILRNVARGSLFLRGENLYILDIKVQGFIVFCMSGLRVFFQIIAI